MLERAAARSQEAEGGGLRSPVERERMNGDKSKSRLGKNG